MDVKEQALVQQLQEAVDAGVVGLWDLRVEQETVHCSPPWKQRLGFPEPQLPDSTHFWRCRVHPDDLEGMLTAMRAHTSGSQASYEASFRLRSNGSGYRLLHSRGRVFECSADGRASRLVGTTIDLTPRPCTPRAGLPDGPRGAVAGRSADLPFHRLLAMQRAGATTGSAAERKRLLLLVEDLVRATLAQLEAQRLPTP